MDEREGRMTIPRLLTFTAGASADSELDAILPKLKELVHCHKLNLNKSSVSDNLSAKWFLNAQIPAALWFLNRAQRMDTRM